VLADADAGSKRMLACTLYAVSEGRTDHVYVHAKVGIADDRWLTVGSANLNVYSHFDATEMNVVSHDPELARATRLRLWSEHLELPADSLDGDPASVIDEIWRPLATEQLERREAGAPPTHRLVGLAHVSRRSKRLLGPLQSLRGDG
jgi:phosphatidylserine/phosphatidylglycerophosphate/cardiolipin synthase-like enzyme